MPTSDCISPPCLAGSESELSMHYISYTVKTVLADITVYSNAKAIYVNADTISLDPVILIVHTSGKPKLVNHM